MTDFTYVQQNDVFDCTQYVPTGTNKPIIEEGEYIALITNTQKKDLKSGNGQGLVVEFTIEQGERAGHKHEETFSLWHNTSEQAIQIAHQNLSSLCYVTGIHKINMANQARELMNSRCVLYITVEERKATTDKGEKIHKNNKIKSFKSVDGRDAGSIAEAIPDAKTRTRVAKKTTTPPQQQTYAPQQQPVQQYPIDTPQQPAPQQPQQGYATSPMPQQGYPTQPQPQQPQQGQPQQAPWDNQPQQTQSQTGSPVAPPWQR